MTAVPLVSVVTASYNMDQYVREAVDSVLAQDWPALEIIVVDDGSTDDTQAVLTAYADEPRVTLISQPNRGQTKAKNAGLAAARGEFVAFCDADNAWLPGKLTRQVPVLQASPSAAVAYGDIVLMDGEGRAMPGLAPERYSGRITDRLLITNFVTFNTTVVRRRVIEEFGGFDESLRMAIDYDLWLRISTRYDFLYQPEPFVRYRIWGGQMSHRQEERFATFLKLFERFLKNYPDSVTPEQVRAAWARNYTQRGRLRADAGNLRGALQDFGRALRYRPHDAFLWKSVARLVAGKLG